MAIAHQGTGTRGAGTTTTTPTLSGAAAGRIALAGRTVKPSTATAATEATWTQQLNVTGGTGSQGIDTGPQRLAVDTKVLTGAEGNPTFDQASTPNSVSSIASIYSAGTGKLIRSIVSNGDDAGHAAGRSATSASIALEVGDVIWVYAASDTDFNTGAWTGATISVSAGAVGATTTRLAPGGSSTGQDAGNAVYEATVTTAGTGTITFSTNADGQQNCGQVGFVVLRESAMSYTAKLAGSSAESHGTGSHTTGSFTPDANSLLVVIGYAGTASTGQDVVGNQTITDSAGLTWTDRVSRGDSTSTTVTSYGLHIWTAPVGGSPTSMTVTFDCGALNVFVYGYSISDYTGYDTSSPVGTTGTAFGTTGGALTLTLGAAPAATSIVAGTVTTDILAAGTAAITPGSMFTELHEWASSTPNAYGQTQLRHGSTSTSVDWVDTDAGTATTLARIAAAIEIKVGAAGTNAPAGNAAGTGAAPQPEAGISPNAANASSTGAANPATATVAPEPGAAAATGSANTPTPTIAVLAGVAEATGTAPQPTVQTGTTAFPQVASETSSSQETGTTTHTVSMPSGSGGRLVMALSFVGEPTLSGSDISAWTQVGPVIGDNIPDETLHIYYRDSDPAGGTISVTSSSTVRSAHHVWRITGADTGTAPAIAHTDNTSTANPPSLDPAGWATEDTLWFALCSAVNDGAATNFTGFPAGYSGTGQRVTAGTAADGVGLGWARLENAVASEDPGGFTGAGGRSTTATLAVRPGVTDANAPAGLAAGTGAANAATATIAPQSGVASATGTAPQPTVTTSASTDAPAGLAAATGIASPATGTVGAQPAAPAGSGIANPATNTIDAKPVAPVAAGSADGTTVETGSFVNAPAGLAAATGTANPAALTIRPNAGLGLAAGGVPQSETTVSPHVGLAAATGSAPGATVQIGKLAFAGLAAATGTVPVPSITIDFTAGFAAAIAEAFPVFALTGNPLGPGQPITVRDNPDSATVTDPVGVIVRDDQDALEVR